MSRAFLDSNVFVYAYDQGAPQKRARAWEVIDREKLGFVISPQVMAEFYAAITRRGTPSISERDAEAAVRDLTSAATIVNPDRETMLEALSLSRKDSLSIWDALIVQCAIAGRCTRLLTEDLPHGRRFGDLIVENPFQDL